mgnify:CR=1 FL=1
MRNSVRAAETRVEAGQANLRGAESDVFTQAVTTYVDVLRDEGEAYGRKLDAAGVTVTSVRYNGMIHDFGLLNALSDVPAVRGAMEQAAGELKLRLK